MCFSTGKLCPYLFPRTSYVSPFFLRTKLDEPPLLHRLCTDFGTEEERKQSEGITGILCLFFWLLVVC